MNKTKAIVLSQVAVTENQLAAINAPTPAQYVKTKPGRGGRPVKFVEGGYVINKLNQVFGPLNWSFKVTERGQTDRKTEQKTDGEVWVYGELTIHDHKKGYVVTKGQTGQHPVHQNVPIGDAYKAAGTDALKKCASLFGIALDVYWGILDTGAPETPKPPKGAGTPPPKPAKPFDVAKEFIRQNSDPQILGNAIQRIKDHDKLTVAEKYQLTKQINAKLGIKDEQQGLL